ncbi:MAG TPA: alpha/beta hydrolase [Bordetella sp.]
MSLKEFSLTVDGLRAQCWEGGSGTPLLLLHGSGPGAASQGTWRLVLEPLMARYRVLATDLIGFGMSDRKAEGPFFDIDLWMKQAHALLDYAGGEKAYVIGHSLSGYLAMRLASEDSRVAKLVTTGTMGANFACNAETEKCWTFPQTREQLRSTLESLMFDRSGITDELLDYRMGILHDGKYGPYFSSMFAGDKQRCIKAASLSPEQLQRIRCPVLMIHGREDIMFPAEGTTMEISKHLPQADILLLSQCRHLPAAEHPGKVAAAVTDFFGPV